MTSAHRAAIVHDTQARRRLFFGALAAAVTVTVLLWVWGRLVLQRTDSFVLIIGAGLLAVGLAADWWLVQRPLQSDLKRGTYFQVTGRTRVGKIRTTCTVNVGTVTLGSYAVTPGLKNLDVSTIDYAPGSRTIFEQRDATGELVTRLDRYRPDAPSSLGRAPRAWTGIAVGVGLGALFVAGFAFLDRR